MMGRVLSPWGPSGLLTPQRTTLCGVALTPPASCAAAPATPRRLLLEPDPTQAATRQRGQATTEVVLLLPLFMFFLYAFAKIFAVLILIQKMEIASYYAARRWQLESHRNVAYESSDMGALRSDILKYVNGYLGVGNPIGGPMYQTTTASFLGIQGAAKLDIKRTQVWQVVTLTVNTQLINTPLFKFPSKTFEVTKYVPNRDRPIAFVLPGLKQ